MTSRSEKRKAVLVDWIDSTSFSTHRWRDLGESKQLTPSKIQSVGFLVAEGKSFITLTGSLCEENNASGCMTIPRGCITRMRRLK
jgi:hypothetical protein